jgi:hypothetical protein
MEAERRVRTDQPVIQLEAGPQTCEKMELLLSTESWLQEEAEDTGNLGLVIFLLGMQIINHHAAVIGFILQAIHLAYQTRAVT